MKTKILNDFSCNDFVYFIASEPWPTDVQLYQPYEVEQVLLPDNANILTVQAFLNMSNLEYTIEMRSNAEHMSPSGRLPFIRANKFIIAEVDPIVSFVNTKGQLILKGLSKVSISTKKRKKIFLYFCPSL